MKKKGFTLIELMIVVAIIGILSAVAIPRFANMIKKAKEAACKGNLGSMRSALSIYYGDNEGVHPTVTDGSEVSDILDLTPTYIAAIPFAKPGDNVTPSTNTVVNETNGTTAHGGAAVSANCGWWYNSGGATSGQYSGHICVDSGELDTKNNEIDTW